MSYGFITWDEKCPMTGRLVHRSLSMHTELTADKVANALRDCADVENVTVTIEAHVE